MRHFVCCAVLAVGVYAGILDSTYQAYDALLKDHVCHGGVDYTSLVKDNRTTAIDRGFSSVDRSAYEAMSTPKKIAYLTNVYNFYTLLLIKRHYPLKTGIRDIDMPWDRKFVPFAGDSVSLNYIEHDVLRKKFNEPRIHFALNCASKDCPALLPEVFQGATLDKQLDMAARLFLRNTAKNRVEGTTLKISKIFKWYGNDFKKNYGGYKRYIKNVLGLSGKYTVEFLDYDWSLNDAGDCD